MYQNKLVASLKANGKILREFKDTVYIPFGSEYSFLIKNLNTTRALVHVYIDGECMTSGGIVLDGGREIDLERSIMNNNLTEGNRFKFIERTGNIEQHRGVKLEDGIVRIEYQFERICLNTPIYTQSILRGIGSSSTGDWIRPMGATYSSTSTNISCSTQSVTDSFVNDVGITIPGSHSTQRFTTTTMGVMESEKHSIVFKLLGETPDNKRITKPVTVKQKPKCVTCGKLNKANAKFCSECGTSLEIFA